ncbi:MAG: phage tail protein [Nanoarchaeota archaeon]
MDDIINKVKNKLGEGVRSNLYRLDIRFPFPTPEIDETSHVLITSTQVPAIKTGSPITQKIVYGKEVKFGSVTRTFDPFTGTVLNDKKLTYRNAFEKWINDYIANWNTNENRLPEEYETDCTLSLLSVDGNTVLKRYKLYNCFPESIDTINLSSDTEEIQKFNFTIHYVGLDIFDE